MTSYVPRTYYRTGRGLSVAVLVSESKIAGRWEPEWPRVSSPGRVAVGRRGSNKDHQVVPMPTIWNRPSGHLAIGAGVREAVPWRSRAPLLPQPGAATVDDLCALSGPLRQSATRADGVTPVPGRA